MSKHYGATVDVYIDGSGYSEDSVSIECGCSMDAEWRCPFAMTETRPAEEGARCASKENGNCRRLAANLDALKRAKRLVAAKIREVEDMME